MSWELLITKAGAHLRCGGCRAPLTPETQVLVESPDNGYSRCHVVGCPNCMTDEEMTKAEAERTERHKLAEQYAIQRFKGTP